jgi:hypothetical protein
MTEIHWPALALVSLFAAVALMAGHWGLQRPRLVLAPPWTYVYGVFFCLLAMAFYCAIVRDYRIPFAVVVSVFTAGGAADFLAYWIDGGATGAESRRQQEIDSAVAAAVAEVRREYDSR